MWLTTCINANGKWNNLKFYLKFWHFLYAYKARSFTLPSPRFTSMQSTWTRSLAYSFPTTIKKKICTCFQLYFCWINLNFNIAHAKCIIIRLIQTQIAEHCTSPCCRYFFSYCEFCLLDKSIAFFNFPPKKKGKEKTCPIVHHHF